MRGWHRLKGSDLSGGQTAKSVNKKTQTIKEIFFHAPTSAKKIHTPQKRGVLVCVQFRQCSFS